MKAKIKSTKWYGWFWPPERRKIKLMQAILDYKMPEIEPVVQEGLNRQLVYGLTDREALNWMKGRREK